MKAKRLAAVAVILLALVGGAVLLQGQRARSAGALAETAAACPDGHDHAGEPHAEESLAVPGLQTLAVQPTFVTASLALTGEVEADAERTARVGSPVSGRLAGLHARVGDRVRAGQVLATVASRDVAEVQATLTRALAEEKAARGRLQTLQALAASGALTSRPLEEARNQHTASVAAVRQAEVALAAARAARDAAAQELERVRQLAAGQAFQARPVEEAKREVARAQGELETARALVKVRQAAYDRSQRLYAAGLSPLREVETAEAELGQARAQESEATTHLVLARQALTREEGISRQDLHSQGEVRTAETALRQAERDVEHEAAELERNRGHLQVAAATLEREKRVADRGLLARRELEEAQAALTVASAGVRAARQSLAAFRTAGAGGAASVSVLSPLSGVVVERPATPGQAVEASSELFTVVDPTQVWVWGNAHEKDLARLQSGQTAEIRVTSYPDRVFAGRVSLIAPALDSQSRTARVRCVVANPEGLLRPGMFASLSVQTDSRRSALLVPRTAVLDEEGKQILFVACQDCEEDQQAGKSVCGAFDKLEVEVGPPHGDQLEIRRGLTAGALVVVQGQHQLKTALGSGQLQAGCTDH